MVYFPASFPKSPTEFVFREEHDKSIIEWPSSEPYLFNGLSSKKHKVGNIYIDLPVVRAIPRFHVSKATQVSPDAGKNPSKSCPFKDL
jgi:hypothetical protein